MESNFARQAEVGVFVLVGVIVLALSIIFLQGDRKFWSSRYRLQVAFNQVQGLSKGSMVFVSGIPAGNIADISFSPNSDKIIVGLDLDSQIKRRITEGSSASVRTLGALGDKYISILPGPRSAPVLPNGGQLISEESEDFIDALAKKGDDIANVANVISELHVLLKNLNHEGRSARLMQGLIQSNQNFSSLLTDTRGAMKHLSKVAERIDKGEGTLGALVNDPTLHQRLISVLGEPPRKTYLKSAIQETLRHRDQHKY